MGQIAELAIGEFHATKTFIGGVGLTEASGLSAATHTRIEISGQARIMPLAAGQTLVTDAGISAIDRLTFNRLGMRVVSANSH